MSDEPSTPGAEPPAARLVRATVLFADVVGFTDLAETIGPERAYFVVRGAVRIVDETARRHGGAVDKYLSDCLLATFGFPVPNANPAAAAAAAAVEMREELRQYNTDLDVPLRLVIGINTGAMVTGDVRGRVARELNILGDAINVAARLKAKAPYGHVYVGPETEQETRDLFEYAPLGALALKGKSIEVPIFDLVGARARPARSTADAGVPLVGRRTELALLAAALAGLASGRGGVILVVGDAGIGKSRLLAEAEALPEAASVRVVHATPGAAGSDEAEPRLLASLLAALGAGATGAALSSAATLAGSIGATLERESTTRPVAVLLDDVPRADAPSLALLPQLADRLAARPVLFIVATRLPDDDPETDDDLEHTLAPWIAEVIRLAPLDAGESRTLVDAVATEALSDESRALVLAHGEGNPGRLVRGVFFEPALRAEHERATSGRRTGETERRRATILFADITGFTALTERVGAEGAFPIVAGCLRVLEDVTHKHGGTVEKLIGDCVMALWGFPEAMEDAPRVAVNAAIEMRRGVRAYSERLGPDVHLDVHIGVHTGLGIAGDVAGALVREFAVMGDPVSVADQLKDLAPAGDVYVGAEMWRATRDVFAYQELPPSPRKGGGVPLRVFRLQSDQERLHRARIGTERRVFSALVGRERELGLLREAVGRVASGTGGIVSIVAPAGLGKSRLLREVATSPEAAATAWSEGRSLATGRHLAYHAIVDFCRSLVGIEDGDDDAQALGKLEAMVVGLLPDEVEEVLPFLAALLGLPLDDARQTRLSGLHGDAMEKLTLRSVSQLLRATSRDRPVVAVMDDLHWADVSSVELFEALLHLAAEHPILFVNVCRPGYPTTSERIRQYAREKHAERSFEVELAPLDAAAARTMLNNLFKPGDLPRDTRQRIEEKAHGNPFFIEEVVRNLVDEGAVEPVNDSFRATDKIGSVTIPDSIHEVVMARVDSLDTAKRQLLQTAAVIGASFHTEILGGVIEDVTRLVEDIEALLHAEFLVRSESERGAAYDFKHPLIQEVTYESLLHARREILHRKVAETMERVFPDDVPGYTGMLAYHYGKGGAAAQAEEYLFRAGAEAARAAAPSEALHFFEEASKLYLEIHRDGGDPSKRALLERNIAEALYYRGRFLEAIEHFNVALRLLGDTVPEGNVQLGLRFARQCASVLARLYGIRLGRRPPPATSRQCEIMELRYARAEVTVTAQPTRHLFDSMDTIAFLQRIDARTVPSAAKFYAGAAALFAFGGLSFGVARRFSERARKLVPPDSNDEYIYQRSMHFTCRVLEGDWDEAHEIAPERIAESVRNGQLWGPTTYLGLLAEKRLHRGDFAGARASLAEVDQIWDVFQYELAKTNFYYLHTLLPLEEGDYQRAREAAEAYYDENPEDLLHILALSAKAKAQTELGDLDAAETTLTHAAEIVTRSAPVPPFHVSAYHRSRALLDVARLAAGDGAKGRRAAQRARKSVRTALGSAAKVAWRRTEVLRLAGRREELVGNTRRALRHYEDSVAWGEKLGAEPETARTWAAVGRMLDGGGATFRGLDGAACRARARAIFEALGLRTDLEAVGRFVTWRLDVAVGATLLSGVLYALAFPPLRLHLLAWVALVPFLIVLRDSRWQRRLTLGVLWSLTSGWSVGTWMPTAVASYFDQPLAIGIALFLIVTLCMAAPYYAAFALAYGKLARGGATAPLVAGAAWAAAELARGRLLNGTLGYVGNSPWATLGYSQAGFPAILQVASVTGVYGISFLLAAVNAGLAEVAVQLLLRGQVTRRAWNALAAAVACGIAALVGGALVLQVGGGAAARENRTPIAIVQGNIGAAVRWSAEGPARTLETYARLTREALAVERPAIVFWPEAAVTSFIEQDETHRRALAATLGGAGELVVGAPRAGTPDGGPPFANSVYLVAADGTLAARYDKQFLLPFMEYFPLRLDMARRQFGRVREFTPGGASPPLPTSAGRAGLLVCNEAFLPHVAAARVAEGATYLVNPSNDSWVPDAGFAAQQFDLAALRAVEQRRFLVRVSDSGPSGVVDPYGRVVAATLPLTRAVLRAEVASVDARSPYGRVGDLFGIGCALVTIAALARPRRGRG